MAVVALVVLTVLAVIAVLERDDPAMEVGSWTYTRDELTSDLEGITGNASYLFVRDQAGTPVPEPVDGEFDADLVAEVLTDRLTFHLAGLALAERGGSVSSTDTQAARVTLTESLVGGPQLAGGPEATLDATLDQFGSWGPTLEEGVATIAALRRLVVAEAVAEGADEEEVDEVSLLLDALRSVADDEGVAVADDLGTYDRETVSVVPVGVSPAELAPLDPEGTAPGDAEDLPTTSVDPEASTSVPADEPLPPDSAIDQPLPDEVLPLPEDPGGELSPTTVAPEGAGP